MAKREKPIRGYKWVCNQGDQRHGCYHPDWDGRCSATAKRMFKTADAAQKAADAHLASCQFNTPWNRHHMGGGVQVYAVR